MREPVIDKEFEALIPKHSAEDAAALDETLKAEGGARDKLVVWNEENILIEGHYRYRFCRLHGLEMEFTYKKFKNREEVKQWIIRNQLGRRNLTPSQAAMLASQLVTTTHGGDRKSDQVRNSGLEKAAKTAGVSSELVSQALKVRREGIEEIAEAVMAGEVKVSDAASIADEPAPRQRRALKAVKSGKATTLKSAVHPGQATASAAANRLRRQSPNVREVETRGTIKRNAIKAYGVLIRALDTFGLQTKHREAMKAILADLEAAK